MVTDPGGLLLGRAKAAFRRALMWSKLLLEMALYPGFVCKEQLTKPEKTGGDMAA